MEHREAISNCGLRIADLKGETCNQDWLSHFAILNPL